MTIYDAANVVSRREQFEKEREERRRKQIRKDRITSIFFTVIILVVMSIPADLFFLIKGSLQPVGFWQNFAMWIGGLAIFGVAQFWFIILGVAALVKAWDI